MASADDLDEFLPESLQYAVDRYDGGDPPESVEAALRSRGLAPRTARLVVAEVAKTKRLLAEGEEPARPPLSLVVNATNLAVEGCSQGAPLGDVERRLRIEGLSEQMAHFMVLLARAKTYPLVHDQTRRQLLLAAMLTLIGVGAGVAGAFNPGTPQAVCFVVAAAALVPAALLFLVCLTKPKIPRLEDPLADYAV